MGAGHFTSTQDTLVATARPEITPLTVILTSFERSPVLLS